MNTSLDYSRIGDEVSIGLTEYVPTGRRLKISALGIDTASSSVQKYSKVDDMLTLLSGNIGTYSMSGLDTDKYTDGQQSIQNIISANIGQEYMILSSSSSSSLSLYKGTYVKGAMSLNLATLYAKPGITALNITPAEEDSAIGSGTHPWPDIYADRINGIDYGTGALGTTSQNIIGAINEINGGLYDHGQCVVLWDNGTNLIGSSPSSVALSEPFINFQYVGFLLGSYNSSGESNKYANYVEFPAEVLKLSTSTTSSGFHLILHTFAYSFMNVSCVAPAYQVLKFWNYNDAYLIRIYGLSRIQ